VLIATQLRTSGEDYILALHYTKQVRISAAKLHGKAAA
jgi:hypothetical protein